MATGPQQKRKELREKRMKAEAAAKGVDRRQNLLKIIGAAVGVALIAVVVVVVVSQSGGDGSKSSGDVDELLSGLQQQGTVLGDPDAPVTLVEFGDMRCPACQQYSETVIPDVIEGPVRDGTANLDFQQWAILGPDSVLAAKAAMAAGEQGVYWSYVEHFFANQQSEATALDDQFLTEIAEAAGVEDIDQWNDDRENNPAFDEQLLEVETEASGMGFTGTPSFAFRNANGDLEPIADSASAEALIAAINDAAPGGGNGQNEE